MKNKNNKGGILYFPLRISILLILILGVFFVCQNAKAEEITTDVIWTKAQSPIIVSEGIWVKPEGSLTIEPGVAVKFASDQYITISGVLNVQGAKDEPIVFTSIKDDEYGGDSNGDGASTQPQSGDWRYLNIGSTAENILDNVIIKYGGGQDSGVVKLYRGKLTISNSTITDNAAGIDNTEGELTISNSAIYDNFIMFIGGIFVDAAVGNNSREDIIVEAENNWWGTTEGPCPWRSLIPSGVPPWQIDIVELCGDRPLVDLGVRYYPWLLSEPTQELEINPVIIVPGIMGSYLYDQAGEEVWPSILNTVIDPWDFHFSKLALPENGEPTGNSIFYPNDIFRNILSNDFFEGLITELESNGYKEGESLFVFPYDWRWSIEWTGGVDSYPKIQSLNEKIKEIKDQTGAEKVDIIAHSMGGLVVKYYISLFGNDSINKFIDIATPHFGSPSAFKTLMYGEDLGIFIDKDRIQTITQNFPSVYQLLPSLNYFDPADQDYNYYIGDVYDMDNNQVKGNLNYAESIDFMKNTGRNSYLLDKATTVHNEIDNLSIGSSYNIIGCGQPTIGKIYVLNKEKSGGWEYGLKYINGDGTVPFRSADGLTTQNKYYASDSEHANIPSADGIRQLVSAILNNNEDNFQFSDYQNISVDTNNCSFSGTQISFHSPIELHIYDENNNHLGPDENGDIEMGIAGAQYDIIGGNKFAFLPAGRNYTIIGRATDTGSFNSRIQNINNGQYGQTVYYNEIPLQTPDSNIQFAIGDGQEEYVIQIDQDGDQIFEEEIMPSSILTGEETEDLTKPETSIIITGEQSSEGKYINEAAMELIAEDNEKGSGILKIEYSLDSGQTWNEYEEAVVFSQAGVYNILYASTDRAGNVEETQVSNFEIKEINIDSVSLEIKDFYGQGLITRKHVKNQLIKRLKWINKYIERYGKKQAKHNGKLNKILEKCEKHASTSSAQRKPKEWCEQKLGKIYNKIIVKLDNVHKKIVVKKYKAILRLLEFYHKKRWISDEAYDIIKEDIEYLINLK